MKNLEIIGVMHTCTKGNQGIGTDKTKPTVTMVHQDYNVQTKYISKGQNGWFYENKNQDFSNKIWVAKNDLQRNNFQNQRQIKQKFVRK